jgi:hypothetical protein
VRLVELNALFDQHERIREEEEEECQPYGCLCTRLLKHDHEHALP